MNSSVPLWAQPLPDVLEAALRALEQAMPHLQQQQHGNPFAIAHLWAERHDAILRLAPAELLPVTEARLRRIGIRWGVVTGPRVTTQFAVLTLPLRRLPGAARSG